MDGRKPWVYRGHVVVSTPAWVDVLALRQRMGMSQNLFAARFGFSLAALRHWERRERRPSGAALTLLNVIKRNPRAVLQALRVPVPREWKVLDDEIDD